MKHLYDFGPYRLDSRERRLLLDGQAIPLEPKAFDLLILLVENAGRLVEKEALMKGVWGDTNVIENNMTRTISVLRKALGQSSAGARYIETVPKRGYRFVAEVREGSERTAPVTTRIVDLTPGASVTNGADPHNSPYVGPQPFPEFSADFFGRDREVEDLVKLLSDPQKRVVLLYSPSGAGKTSLINAALRPALLNDGSRVLPTSRVGLPAGPAGPLQNPYTFSAIASMGEETGSTQNPEPVTWAKHSISQKHSEGRTVLVVDQLEEIVTTAPSQYRQQRGFFVEIREALEQNPSLHVLFAFREEYFGALQRLAVELSDLWTPYPMGLLRREDAREAVRRPALRQGVIFEPDDVLTLLVNKLCDGSGEFVEPLQLQLICGELWRSLTPGHRKISWEDLRQAMGEDGSGDDRLQAGQTVSRFVEFFLHDFCKKAVRSASASWPAVGGQGFPEELIDLACLQFVTERGTRTPVRRDAGWTGDLPNEIADELVSRHFLRIEPRREECWYELAHDTLIRPVLDRAGRIDDEALREVFSRAVRNIAATDRVRKEGIEEATIAQECCLAFVAEDGSQLRVQHESMEAASGRLPLSVIEAFVQSGILRGISHQGQKGYEMLHWRLALAIHRKRFPTRESLYRTRKRLETFLEDSRSDGASFAVWYQRSDRVQGILVDVEEIIGSANLSEMEANFVLRASLASGYHVKEFILQIGKRLPAVIAEILREASQFKFEPKVRRNAVSAMGLFHLDDRETILLDLALKDPDESVRKDAANTLAEFERSSLLERLFTLQDNPAEHTNALTVLAWIHDAMPDSSMPKFEEGRKRLSRSTRARLRARLTSIRWRNARTRIFMALAVAMGSTILFTVPPRALLASFGLTITQVAKMGFFEGAFQGVTGAILWGLFIGGSLLCWWFVGEGRRPWRGRSSAFIGASGGLVGGIVNTLSLVLVYGHDSLSTMSWIPLKSSSLIGVLTETGLAFAMPVYGALIGLGVGEVTRRMLPWWSGFLERNKGIPDHPEMRRAEMRRVFGVISSQLLSHLWLIFIPMCAAVIALRVLLLQMPHSLHMPHLSVGYWKLLGEAISLFFGGVGLVIGLFLGLHILRRGLPIPSLED